MAMVGVYIERESTLCWVMVREWGQQNPDRDDNVLIKVEAPMLWDVKRTPEVYQVGRHRKGQYYSFGRVICYKGKADELTNLYFSCTILGDNVDETELLSVVNSVLDNANNSTMNCSQFGGRLTAHEIEDVIWMFSVIGAFTFAKQRGDAQVEVCHLIYIVFQHFRTVAEQHGLTLRRSTPNYPLKEYRVNPPPGIRQSFRCCHGTPDQSNHIFGVVERGIEYRG
jgi:hypothetical protein